MTVSYIQKGTTAARLIRAIAAGRGDPVAALGFAEGQGWRDTPSVIEHLKAAVDPLGTSEMTAAVSPVGFDFAELLRPQTIIGKMTGLRRQPFNIRTLIQTVGAGVAWVGQGAPKPAGELAFDPASAMTWSKVSGIVPFTKELLLRSNPAADSIIAADLSSAVSTFMDRQFVDPTIAAVPDVSPASITNGVAPIHSSGSTVDAIDNDLAAVVQSLLNAGMQMAAPFWLMHPRTATALALKRGTGGAPAYPQINARGGSLVGIPVLVSSAISTDYGSPSATYIVLADASEILLADDGQATIDYTEHAALQMDSAPSDGAQPLVSLWQNDMVAVKATRYINWRVRRPGAVAWLDGAVY